MNRKKELIRIHLIFPQADYGCECRFSGNMSLNQMLGLLSEILPEEVKKRYEVSGSEHMIMACTNEEADMDVAAASLNLYDGAVLYVI